MTDFAVPPIGWAGVIVFAALGMVVLVPPLTLLVQWRYRRAVQESMRRSARGHLPRSLPPPPSGPPTVPPPLAWQLINKAGDDWLERGALKVGLVRSMQRRTLAVHAAAALAYALAASAVFHLASDLEWLPVRFVTLGLLLAWPLVPTVLHVMGGGARNAMLVVSGYLVASLIPGALRGAGLAGMLFVAAYTVMPPAVLLLSLTHPRLRAVGPFLAPAALVASLGFALWPWMAVPLVAIGTTVEGSGVLLFLVVSAIALAVAFVGLRLVGIRYETGRSSDRGLLIGQWWLLATMWFAVTLFLEDARYVALPFVAFALHQMVTALGSRALRANAPEDDTRLLFLRTFGSRRRSERLLRDVTRSWTYLGTVQMIAGPDLATASLQPHEFLDYVRGRLARRFVQDAADLEQRMASSAHRPDRDGRYRVEEYFCHDDTWRMTVARLAGQSRVVLMDLRAFTPKNRGVAYELAALVDLYPLAHVVFAVDGSTDATAVRGIVEQAWRRMRPTSPNRTAQSTTVRVLDLDKPMAETDLLSESLAAAASTAPAVAPAHAVPVAPSPLMPPATS